MKIELPQLSLVLLIGPSGSGKSTFARQHFLPTEVLSSDFCRGLVSNDENNQAATGDAFDLLHTIVAKRLQRGLLTVVDATNVQPESRRPLVKLAKQMHVLPVAIVLDMPEKLCQARNQERPDRNFGPHVVRQQRSQLRKGLKGLKKEGIRNVTVLSTADEVESVTIQRVPLWNDRRGEHGPFDIIGDLHGCASELEQLLEQLGYQLMPSGESSPWWGDQVYQHPEGRQAFFVGDLVDRGPRVLDCVKIVRNMVQHGSGLCVPGNHDMKLVRAIRGKDVQRRHGLEQSMAEVDALPEAIRKPYSMAIADFLDGLVSHLVLDDGKLVVAHAGMKEAFQGRSSGKVREFALFGEPTGEIDEHGLPVRADWAAEYRGSAMVVFGHTPVAEPLWLNNTVNIDTGCVFGGKLTALRYPENQIVSVAAQQTYYETARPFLQQDSADGSLSAQQQHDDLLDIDDVRGKRIISTSLQRNITIREENATAALEVMSRFAANPKWLIYLPPTMSPCGTSELPGLLEHPAEAFDYFQQEQVARVVCQEKHMGSRAVVVICRNADAALDRFGVTEEETGIVYTRTGRRFFNDAQIEAELLDRLRNAMDASGFWETFETDWACFDCELMPWSAKAQELLRSQYAAVGAAGTAALEKTIAALTTAGERLDLEDLPELTLFHQRQTNVQKFVEAYRQYCWPVESIGDLKLAPFHLLATEGRTHTNQNHVWHMQTLAKVCKADPGLLLATQYKEVDLTDPAAVTEAIEWWQSLTDRGGEGMVVKPLEWIARRGQELVQPAVKCRGKEYLRIIYSPDYDTPENLTRLRKRGLGRKRSLALREFALGIESLERFVRREPLRRVHECVFGVLALESEPVDPRL
ncbi:polynucleotide kinase-phosphatase [Bremerella sp. JC817]|uniref:polynucleotide kinase-phosphatase n=1 Tax=Bremerella sp. JC817 TaxID=3231756 RepID=UPI003458D7A3